MADPNVLEAQKWVNATYHGKAPGYLRCMEDGRTGWGVVLSLTQALQHELGISPTVQNFGPGTFAKVASTIKPDLTQQTNTNILRIYNYALWCKGYYGSANAGTWDLRAKLSIGELLGDMGLPDTQNPIEARMWAHVTKALLRMDQFRLIPGGDGVIRGFQQTLNRDYVRLGVVPAMGLSPCDGNYDRVTQQCLMMAIQYRLGLNPADITGYFGDGTTRELKKHTLTTGSAASELTYLLHAACYFNSPAYKGAPYGSGGETFDFPWDTIRLVDNGRKFTADTAAWLRHYQEFMLLATSGNATFDTWAQLLISRGDQHRAATGSDTSVTITPERARALVAKGYKVVGRYLDEHLPPDDPDYIGKALVPGEPKTIIDAGLRLMPIFQYNGTVPGNFTYQKGYDQAGKAHDKMVEHHMLQGACIYFAVDYDAQDHEISQFVIPYFNGVRKALADKGGWYWFGVYGTRNVCTRVSEATGARWSFVSGMSFEFSGNLGFPMPQNWSFSQIYEFNPANGTGFTDGNITPIGLDKNVWRGDGYDPAVKSLHLKDDQYAEITAFMGYVKALENAFARYRRDNGESLAIADQRQDLCLFFRQYKYIDLHWNQLLGAPDAKRNSYAAGQAGALTENNAWPRDPIQGITLDMQHCISNVQGYLKSTSGGDEVRMGDATGWFGDAVTLYVEWRNTYRHLSGSEMVNRYLASTTHSSAWALDDYLSDADALSLSQLLLANPDLLFSDVLTHYYSPTNPSVHARHRYRNFLKGRFQSDQGTARSRITRQMLGEDMLGNAIVYALARELILKGEMPDDLPLAELESFTHAIADRMYRDATEEPT